MVVGGGVGWAIVAALVAGREVMVGAAAFVGVKAGIPGLTVTPVAAAAEAAVVAVAVAARRATMTRWKSCSRPTSRWWTT